MTPLTPDYLALVERLKDKKYPEFIDPFGCSRAGFSDGATNETLIRAMRLQGMIEAYAAVVKDMNKLCGETPPLSSEVAFAYAGIAEDYKYEKEKAEQQLAELLKGAAK